MGTASGRLERRGFHGLVWTCGRSNCWTGGGPQQYATTYARLRCRAPRPGHVGLLLAQAQRISWQLSLDLQQGHLSHLVAEAISAIVLETLADLGITERQELTGPLTDEAAAEVALVREAPAGAVVSEGITPHPQLVTNTASGVQHRILVGPPVLPSAQWHTVCGWRFGALDHAIHSQESRSRCEKCFR